MMPKKRFSDFLSRSSVVILLMFLAAGMISCSGKGSGTVAPPITTDDPIEVSHQFTGFQSGHNIMGICSVRFDTGTWTTQVVFHRSAEIHINLTAFLGHPNCPDGSCLTWYVTGHDAAKNIYRIDMVLTNPTIFTAYDMRIIFLGLPYNEDTEVGWSVDNPDSYTTIWDTDPPWDEDEQWLNPFIAFEKEDLEREFDPDPDGNGPEVYSDTETLYMHVPPESSSEGEIMLVLDASWPNNCNEPYEIVKMWQDGDLPPGAANPTSAVNFECIVADWEPDIQDVSVYIPDIIDNDTDGWVQMYQWPTTGPNAWPPIIGMPPWDQDIIDFLMEYGGYDISTLRKYWCNVANDLEATVGLYEAIVRAESIDPDGQGFDTMYNVYDFDVDVGGSGGDEEERLMIVFASYMNGDDSDIFCYYFLTNEIYQLTDDQGAGSTELEPCVDQQGGQIAFISNCNSVTGELGDFDIYMLDFDQIYDIGTGLPKTTPRSQWTPVTTTDEWDERMPDFSPNGEFLAYASYEFGQFEICTIEPGSPQPRMRVTMSYGSDEAPNFDRFDQIGDCENLYFHSDRAGGGNYEIYSIDPTEEESSFNLPERHTFTPEAADLYPSSQGPGGPGVAWTSDREGNWDIFYYVPPDGEIVNLTELLEEVNWDMYPSFSTDGMWITFMSDRSEPGVNLDIWRMTWEGGNWTRMTDSPAPDLDPCYGGG